QALELELNGERRSGRSRPAVAIADHADDLRVVEDRRIKLRRFFGLLIEPEEGRNSLNSHDVSCFGIRAFLSCDSTISRPANRQIDNNPQQRTRLFLAVSERERQLPPHWRASRLLPLPCEDSEQPMAQWWGQFTGLTH